MDLPGFEGLIYDKNELPLGSGPDENPLLIFPSYLKQLEGPILQSIWDQAARALTQAEEVTFVGYSLPLADVAVRALINRSLRVIQAAMRHRPSSMLALMCATGR
jgi:hypothetical protein